MSLSGIAEGLGIARKTLQRWRKADPPLALAIDEAFAAYEEKMVDALEQAVVDNKPSDALQIQRILANRFPWKYGSDPRMRDIRAELHPEDAEDEAARQPTTPGGLLDQAIDALLDRRTEPSE